MEKENNIDEKINSFFRLSMLYFGKEIAMQTNHFFSIDQRLNESGENEEENETDYSIQWGFPQSGSVYLKFRYNKEEKEISINELEVFAPPKGEPIMIANLNEEQEEGPMGIHINTGMDTGTIKHHGKNEIMANPNAIKMLDIANKSLAVAEVIGDCNIHVPVGSDSIPCCSSVYIPKKKGKNI